MKKSFALLALVALGFAALTFTGCKDEPTPGIVSIAGNGFDIDEVQTIFASEQAAVQVKVDVAASKGIDKLLVQITTSNETFKAALAGMGLDGEFDLANPGALADVLSSDVVNLPNGAAVKGKTTLPFDISNFVPMIFAVAQGSDMTADFKLTVADAEDTKETKTLKLQLMHDSQLPNSGFEDWSPYSAWFGSIWYPSKNLPLDNDELPIPEFWDTANEGLSVFSANNITMYDETDLRPGTEGTRSVKMKSIEFLEKFATGNIYSGYFGEITTDPLGANVYFGRPFTARPSALKGWYKASPGTVTNAGAGAPKSVGDPDEYQIYIMLTDWTEPREVNTSIPETLIDFNADYVIGLGQMSDIENIDLTKPVTEWTEFEIPIEYRSDKTPSYVVVVACASRYGDYLTGSTASVLQIDDFELVYE